MFDPGINQGAGLHAFAATPAPRIVALTSYGNRQAELSLLWSLCSAWSDLDYTVLVLDVTTPESDAQPGLLHLLANRHQALDAYAEGVAWPILPAAHGFLHLCGAAAPGDEGAALAGALAQRFAAHDVVLVYADAAALAAAFAGSALQPLLALSASRVSTLSAYRALKLMLLKGRLQPTMVAPSAPSEPTSMPRRHDLSASLQDCAQAFLGQRLTTVRISPRQDGDALYDDTHRLALRLLENALLPQRPARSASTQPSITHEDRLARKH